MKDKSKPSPPPANDALRALIANAYVDEDLLEKDGCQSPEWWFELAAGHMDPKAAQSALNHAARCARCSSEKILAEAFVEAQNEPRTVTSGPTAIEPDLTGKVAKPLSFPTPTPSHDTNHGSERRNWNATRWLAAAAVILAIGGTYTLTTLQAPTVRPPGAGENLRSQTIDVSGLAGELESAPSEFEWTDVGAATYRVQITRVDGRAVLDREVDRPRLTLAREEAAALERFVTYRLTVTAAVDGTELRSPETTFRITGAGDSEPEPRDPQPEEQSQLRNE